MSVTGSNLNLPGVECHPEVDFYIVMFEGVLCLELSVCYPYVYTIREWTLLLFWGTLRPYNYQARRLHLPLGYSAFFFFFLKENITKKWYYRVLQSICASWVTLWGNLAVHKCFLYKLVSHSSYVICYFVILVLQHLKTILSTNFFFFKISWNKVKICRGQCISPLMVLTTWIASLSTLILRIFIALLV